MAATLSPGALALLSEPHVGVLATVSRRGRPQATPVWFLVEDGRLLVNTSQGRVKLRNLEAHPYLALTVVDPRNAYRWVQIQGRVLRFDWESGARDIDRLSMRYRGQPYTYQGGDGPQRRVSLLIEPLRVHGPAA
jgi:PPOX class probable F420-dependent enzyme